MSHRQVTVAKLSFRFCAASKIFHPINFSAFFDQRQNEPCQPPFNQQENQ